MVSHSHDDVGWKSTAEELYSGINEYGFICIKTILDGVIEALLMDSSRRFTYVEIFFLKMWYER